MTRKLSGRCACGAVSYECEADPVMMFNCHCRDCQRASGTAYAAIVIVLKANVRMRGEPRYHKVVGNAGSGIERGFCGACGSQLLLSRSSCSSNSSSPSFRSNSSSRWEFNLILLCVEGKKPLTKGGASGLPCFATWTLIM